LLNSNNNNNNNNNTQIYNVHSIEANTNQKCVQSPGGQKQFMLVSA